MGYNKIVANSIDFYVQKKKKKFVSGVCFYLYARAT